jgi:hypothetical protein
MGEIQGPTKPIIKGGTGPWICLYIPLYPFSLKLYISCVPFASRPLTFFFPVSAVQPDVNDTPIHRQEFNNFSPIAHNQRDYPLHIGS